MTGSFGGCKMNILDDTYNHIDKIQHANTDSEVVSILRNLSTSVGFEHFIISGIPRRGVKLEPFVLASHWPKEWFKRYMERDYVEVDPVARASFQTADPFQWSTLVSGIETGTPQCKLMDDASSIGLQDGLCVPIHTEDGMHGVVSFGGGMKDWAPESTVMLHLISLYAHGRLRLLRRPPFLKHKNNLSKRELEVLRWAASGKTSEDIATLVGLKRRTVDFHFKNAATKLGTVNRIHTVAEAMSYQLIQL